MNAPQADAETRPESETRSDSETVTLLIQGDDIGDSCYWYRWWLDDPQNGVRAWLYDRDGLQAVLDELDAALPVSREGESVEQSIRRAQAGALTDPVRERDLMTRLGGELFTSHLQAEILAQRARGHDVHIRMTPPPSCARVPWSLVILPGDGSDVDGLPARLGRLAVIEDDVPAAFHVGRGRAPVVGERRQGSLRVIDPDLKVPGTRLFTGDQWRRLRGDDGLEPGGHVDAGQLSDSLNGDVPPASLLYVGHVSGGRVADGSTSLRLTPSSMPRMDIPSSALSGRLTARDLVAGTIGDTESPSPRAGFEIWPMPPRVGIVACNSGSDLGRREPFGLIIACLNAGAEYAVGTRWVLPADRAWRAANALSADDPQPLCDTALDVARILDSDDPVLELAQLLRHRLDEWDRQEAAASSPLVWGALAMFHAAPRSLEELRLDD